MNLDFVGEKLLEYVKKLNAVHQDDHISLAASIVPCIHGTNRYVNLSFYTIVDGKGVKEEHELRIQTPIFKMFTSKPEDAAFKLVADKIKRRTDNFVQLRARLIEMSTSANNTFGM